MEPTEPANRVLLRPESWPAGHRSALAVIVDLDPREGERPAAANDAAGADRLLNMLADLDIAPTVVVDPGAAAPTPVPEGVIIDGAARHAGPSFDPDMARDAVRERLDTDMRGVVLTGAEPAENAAADDLWVMERRPAPLPERTQRGTVVVPYTAWWDAGIWFDPQRPSPPSAMLESWSVSLASVRTRGELMAVAVPIRAASLPGTVETIQRFLDEAVGAGDVWITNATAVASHAASAANTDQE